MGNWGDGKRGGGLSSNVDVFDRYGVTRRFIYFGNDAGRRSDKGVMIEQLHASQIWAITVIP